MQKKLLEFNGGVAQLVRSVVWTPSSNSDIPDDGDTVVLENTSNFTGQLPKGVENVSLIFDAKYNLATHPVTLVAHLNDTINGEASIVLNKGNRVYLKFYNSGWQIMTNILGVYIDDIQPADKDATGIVTGIKKNDTLNLTGSCDITLPDFNIGESFFICNEYNTGSTVKILRKNLNTINGTINTDYIIDNDYIRVQVKLVKNNKWSIYGLSQKGRAEYFLSKIQEV